MTSNFVFDIDDTIVKAIDYEQKEQLEEAELNLGKDFLAKVTITACEFPHFVFPGFFALFKWLDAQGGKLLFFSSAAEERNVELVPQLLRLSFAERSDEIAKSVKIFSRQHCIDTEKFDRKNGDLLQSLFWGRRKKKLSNIVVPAEQLPNTVLIDDDSSYRA